MSSLAPRHTFYVRSAVFPGTLVLYTKGLASIIDGGLVLTLHPRHKDTIIPTMITLYKGDQTKIITSSMQHQISIN